MNWRDQLIEEHLNCVHWVIHNSICVNPGVCGLEYDDLYQEGCIALWRAAETFDERRGTQFHSYAISVIHNYLLDYCRKIQSRTVQATQQELAQKIEKLYEDAVLDNLLSRDAYTTQKAHLA